MGNSKLITLPGIPLTLYIHMQGIMKPVRVVHNEETGTWVMAGDIAEAVGMSRGAWAHSMTGIEKKQVKLGKFYAAYVRFQDLHKIEFGRSKPRKLYALFLDEMKRVQKQGIQEWVLNDGGAPVQPARPVSAPKPKDRPTVFSDNSGQETTAEKPAGATIRQEIKKSTGEVKEFLTEIQENVLALQRDLSEVVGMIKDLQKEIETQRSLRGMMDALGLKITQQ